MCDGNIQEKYDDISVKMLKEEREEKEVFYVHSRAVVYLQAAVPQYWGVLVLLLLMRI
jgi:hypothetical protein